MSTAKWLVPVALGLSLLLWISSDGSDGPRVVEDLPSVAIAPPTDDVVLRAAPPEARQIQPVREREETPEPVEPVDPLRSRVQGLGLVLDEGHELAWEAGVECLAVRLGPESVDDLIDLAFTPDLDIDETLVIASVLTRLQDERQERILGFPDRAYVQVRRSLKGGGPTDNDARDLASWRAAAAFGSTSEVANLLDIARAAEDPPRYLKALEVAPSLEVAMALVDWENSIADPNLLEWMRLRQWVLGPSSRDAMAVELVQRATNSELSSTRRDGALPVLMLMGFETTEAAFLRSLNLLNLELEDVKPLVLAMYEEWPEEMVRESQVPVMLKAQRIQDRAIRSANKTAQAIVRGHGRHYTPTDTYSTSFQDAVDKTETQIQRAAISHRLARLEPADVMSKARAIVKTENRAAITLAIILVADDGTRRAHDWFESQLELEHMEEHHAFLQLQRVRLRALLGMQPLADLADADRSR